VKSPTELHGGGVIVLHGRCDPDVVFPYEPIAEAIRQLVRRDDALGEFAASRVALGLLVPELATQDSAAFADGAAERAAVFAATAAMLAFAAQREPVLLAIDDAHWATQPTLQLVRHLLRATLGARVLVTITYRDTEVAPRSPLSELLGDLHSETGVERLSLGGLDERNVADLVRAAGSDDDPSVVVVCGGTRRKPVLLIETCAISPKPGPVLRQPIRDVIALRVSRLPEDTRSTWPRRP